MCRKYLKAKDRIQGTSRFKSSVESRILEGKGSSQIVSVAYLSSIQRQNWTFGLNLPISNFQTYSGKISIEMTINSNSRSEGLEYTTLVLNQIVLYLFYFVNWLSKLSLSWYYKDFVASISWSRRVKWLSVQFVVPWLRLPNERLFLVIWYKYSPSFIVNSTHFNHETNWKKFWKNEIWYCSQNSRG